VVVANESKTERQQLLRDRRNRLAQLNKINSVRGFEHLDSIPSISFEHSEFLTFLSSVAVLKLQTAPSEFYIRFSSD